MPSYITLDMQLSYEFIKPEAEPLPTVKDSKDSKNVMQPVAETPSIWQRMLWGTKLTVGVNNAFDRHATHGAGSVQRQLRHLALHNPEPFLVREHVEEVLNASRVIIAKAGGGNATRLLLFHVIAREPDDSPCYETGLVAWLSNWADLPQGDTRSGEGLVFGGTLNYQIGMATQALAVAKAGPQGNRGKQSAPPAVAKASPWILDRWRDLLLFVGTPVLLIPIFTAAQSRWSAQDIFLFVGAFGAMGHHLPGMIRAYGDRALFQRFKIRFIVAPLAILAVCLWSSF